MRNLARLANRLYNTALLIEPAKADALDAVFRAALEQRWEKPVEAEQPPMDLVLAATPFQRTRAGYMRSDNGIALIQALGPLVQRGAGIDAWSGGFESYENLSKQLRAAQTDPMVRGIVFEIDSPGGEASGVAALASQIRDTANEKPVLAHANEFAFSAAYWLAAAADELYAPASGMVGSVGVILLHVDQSQMNAKRGLDVTHIHAGARKADFSPHQPLSDEALGRAQAMVDRLYGQFVAAVATARGIDERVVRDTEAGLLNPDEAEDLGMVDGTASLDETVQRLTELIREPSSSKRDRRAAVSAHLEGDAAMSSTTTGKPAAAPAQEPAATFTQADLDKARAEGAAQGKKDAEGEAQANAAKAAQAAAEDAAKTRVAAILSCDEAKERPTLSKHIALKTSMSVEDGRAMLAASPKESAGNALAAAMPANPAIGAEAGAEAPKLAVPNANSIYTSMQDQRLRVINGGAK